MTYSCGIFKDNKTTLEQASIEKLDRICKKLQLSSDDHILEIGTGWEVSQYICGQKLWL